MGLGEGGHLLTDLLALKKYAMAECMSVEIGMQTHSKCVKNKSVHKDSCCEFYSLFLMLNCHGQLPIGHKFVAKEDLQLSYS